MYASPLPPRSRSRSRGQFTGLGRWASLLLALLIAITSMVSLAGPASAATVYEIDGRWEPGTPGTVAKGDVVTAVWRVNVNDDRPAPSNDPVDNVTFTVTLDHGLFKAIPDLCRTTGVDPVSAISDDGRTLTCNLGTVVQGTAVLVQTPVVADGITGDQITATGTIDGLIDELEPINIVNTFGMDMLWGTPTPYVAPRPGNAIDFDFQWTLFQDRGSDPGPNTVSYDITVPLGTGQPLELGYQATYAPWNSLPCVPFQNSSPADGHPYSEGYGAPDQNSPFVENCELVQTGPNSFRMTLTGIDYSLTQVPTRDSAGNAMPTDRVAVASGSIWLRVRNLTEGTSANLTATAPTYTSTTGLTDQDNPSNNTSSKVITFPGGWSHAYGRWATGSGGTNWDNTYKVAPGTTVVNGTGDTWYTGRGFPDTDGVGECNILDTQFVTYDRVQANAFYEGDAGAEAPAGMGTMQWYVGNDPLVTPGSGSYNPNAFTCAGNDGWVSAEPTDKSTVKAVRWVSTVGAIDGRTIQLWTWETIKADAPIGQDIWTFAAVYRAQEGGWIIPFHETNGANSLTPVPNSRYNYTSYARDVLHVVFATPAISKATDRQVVKPGEPATFTLTYSANGSGSMPPTVDDFRIVDTLPVGMTYVDGSATPAPSISTDGQGRQVLTWDLDGVPSNTAQALTYQAVASESVTPGQTLANTVTATLRGETAQSAAQVTVSTNGYTLVSKTADTPFIPNLTGEGDGEGVWTVNVRSFDPLPQAFTDTIDILPFEGDARGTDYEGSYTLTGVDVPDGQTVYYTTADPTTVNDDPANASNGAAGNPVGNTIGWTPVYTPDATAIRVIGPRLDPGVTQSFKVRIATDGADGEDLFVNRAQGRAGHTELKMRTSAPMTVANYYSAALKKYVQDRKGKWHDAQDLTDYPTFRYGDTVRYRIVVENTGQGTITNLDITDDQQPALGNFHVDSLAPGETESHEFEFVLDESTNGTVVNTACATADIPSDSQVPPTINCDPAGFDVANYSTVKSSDPKPGSVVYPGQKVKYTVTVTQQGTAPADAEFTDNLAKVLDDATYNGDIKASLGIVKYRKGHIAWTGTIPVGGVAKVTYSVTVKGTKKLGNRRLFNPVTSPGCEVQDGQTVNCDTDHRVGKYDLVLDKSVVGGAKVMVGGIVKYALRVSNRGPDVAPAPIKLRDNLPKGLDVRTAYGEGWDCRIDKAKDKVACVREHALGPDRNAAPVFVVARATTAALGRRLVNTAAVNCEGETKCSNNPDTALVSVVRVPPAPSTGYRPWLPMLDRHLRNANAG